VPAPVVRTATPADREAIGTLLSSSSAPVSLTCRAIDGLGAPDPCVVIAHAQDGAVAGVGMLEVTAGPAGTARVGRVVLLVVHEACRGRGVGAALLEALRREALARGCREVRVATPRATGRQ
jgi:GNAT superfamily N-acetyltransferase